MSRVLLINAAEAEETRAALLEDGRLEEYRCERTAAGKLVGNIYKGRVVNLERGIGAAFVDIGVGRNAFLHASDCCADGDEAPTRLDDLMAVGDEIVVQVTRESIGPKGPVLTQRISIAGRFLVLLTHAAEGGVSRRIDERGDRTKLRAFVRQLEQRAGMGLIVRTAGADAGRRELMRDLRTLRKLWASVEAEAAARRAPALLHVERDLVARAVRDLADRGVTEIHVDAPEALERAESAVRTLEPALVDRMRLYDAPVPLFHAFDLEAQIDGLHARRVTLPGGGSIVFDRTEALLAVDVNSGRMREEDGLEGTAHMTNLEAAEEIARQLRLRDLGGVVAVDFIDMREADHVREVERRFKAALRRDRARIRTGRLGAFGVFVLTRQRAGDGVVPARRTCPRCGGTGEVVRPDEIALRVFRELRARAAARKRRALVARVGPEVAEILHGARAGAVAALAEDSGRGIEVRPDATLPPGRWEVAEGPAKP